MIGIKDQQFGVEIEMTGITRHQAAQELAAYFENPYRRTYDGYDSYTVEDDHGRTWKLMSDASIRGEMRDGRRYVRTGDNSYAVEFVTPVLKYEDMDTLQECIRTLRQAGAKVNSSCGLHVHVDGANHNRQSLKNLMSIMYAKEDILFKALQVQESRVQRWCQRVRVPVLEQTRRLSSEETTDLTQLENIWYGGRDRQHPITAFITAIRAITP